MASRDIKMLNVSLQEKYHKFEAKMKETGLPFVVTCTSRSIVEQMALFVQGRLKIKDVNRFRFIAGLMPIRVGYNRKVTWTLNSKHVTNFYDKNLDNDFARAFDIVLTKNGKALWDIKADVNENEVPDYEEAGRIGESVGLVWGGRWGTPDYVHFQE